jgi:lipid II:glycine glycyltransferase (peptidoglycan interpeptide bridge formation enzyme)
MTLRIETKFDLPNSWLKENGSRPPFCQSFEWEEILSREEKSVERLTIIKDGEPICMALIEYHNLPFGWRYAFCPKGPIIRISKSEFQISKIFELVNEYLKSKKCIFFRFEPFIVEALNQNSKIKILKSIDVNPRATMILDLRQTPDELLGRMHQKTRYNINLAQKKNLRVTDDKNADLFLDLMKRTAKRDKFRLHEERHYHEIIFSPLTQQLTVFFESKPIATAVFAGFGDTFTYVFGASDYEYRSLMAPYLIQWEGIKMGQRYGYKFYDFFGVAPMTVNSKQTKENSKQENENYSFDSKHQYAGVTRFKQGFGGEYFEAPGTYDLVIAPWKYKIYKLLRALRRFI